MYTSDVKSVARVGARLSRVLVAHPEPGPAWIIADLVKAIAKPEIAFATTTAQALLQVEKLEPDLIVCDFAGRELDGIEFTRKLRRGRYVVRKAPVIMTMAEATAPAILAARNAGVHEVLRKPFGAGDFYRRVEAVMLKPRLWIEAEQYVGPDRRRFNSGEFNGQEKRRPRKLVNGAAILKAS